MNIQILYTANYSRWERYAVFAARSILQTSSKIACAIGFGYTRLMSNDESFLVNNSSNRESFPSRTIRNVQNEFSVTV